MACGVTPYFIQKTESYLMPRDTPAPLTAMQKVQLASARQKLRIETAKAKEIEEAVDPDVTVNQFGRPIVPYAELPEIEAVDQAMLDAEFERLACPHWAVKKYRPGFGPKNELRKLSRDSWYFYETGQAILQSLLRLIMADEIPDLVERLSTDTLDMQDAIAGLFTYLELEHDAKREAVLLHRTTLEKLDRKDKAELAEIRKSLDKRYEANLKRNQQRDNRPVTS